MIGLKVKKGVKADREKIKRTAEAALRYLGLGHSEISILLTDDRGIKELNKTYRNIDKPTDVLSFHQDEPSLLGDVVISVEKAKMQAKNLGMSLDRELGRLFIHGLLHLVGYDHAKGGWKAKRMKEKEEEILKNLRKVLQKRE